MRKEEAETLHILLLRKRDESCDLRQFSSFRTVDMCVLEREREREKREREKREREERERREREQRERARARE